MDARSFWGGTYFPPTGRYGRLGFVDALNAIDKAWRGQKESIKHAIRPYERPPSRITAPSSLQPSTFTSLANGIYGMSDHRQAGLKEAPKFPNAPFMRTLWLSWRNTGNESHHDSVIASTRAMLRGGIYDHVDDDLVLNRRGVANWAYAATGDEMFRLRIEGTIDWLLREMRTPMARSRLVWTLIAKARKGCSTRGMLMTSPQLALS